jgi:polyisoprenoid-binding protein YceI
MSESENIMLKHTLLAFSLLAVNGAFAQAKRFDIVGERLEYRNLATVESITEFETFTGRTSKVTGSLTFDPKKKTGTGSIAVDVASIDTGIPLRNEHMREAGWLDAAKYPNITFTANRVQYLGGDQYRVTGTFTMKGVSKPLTTTATVRYRAAGEATKAAGFDGDVVQVTTKFKIKLSDFNVIIPAPAKGKVANEVLITLSAYGVAK